MKEIKILTLCVGIGLMSCDNSSNQDIPAPPQPTMEETEMVEEVASEEEIAAIVEHIDSKRTEIEGAVSEPVEISTSTMRAKIQQKWSKIHFYTMNGEVVRIKTYPHSEVSARTEEFYLEGGELILAVIEDEGGEERGKTNEEMDKMYYYADGELIKEVHNEEEGEFTLRDSDAEELLSEVEEYLQAFNARG